MQPTQGPQEDAARVRRRAPANPQAFDPNTATASAGETLTSPLQRIVERPAAVRPSEVLELQHTLGNQAVSGLVSRSLDGPPSRSPVVQRDDLDSGTDQNAAAQQPDPMAGLEWSDSVEGSYQAAAPDPIDVPPDAVNYGPGDYPTPNPNPDTAMAMHVSPSGGRIQRDDSQPGMSADATLGAQTPVHTPPGSASPGPVTFSGTLLIRDANIFSFGFKNPVFKGLDIGHEPSWTWSIDSKWTVQQQIGITLINTHWQPFWGKEIEAGLSAFLQSTVFPSNSNSAAPGGQLQIEQHIIIPWFSVTLTGSTVYDPNSHQMATTGGINLLFHAPALRPQKSGP
ncbi:MAG: hypothetical protein JO352_14525 [Chloroflexi bacterium]|nr:hypothetical protein [Chloroflexota bacterium]